MKGSVCTYANLLFVPTSFNAGIGQTFPKILLLDKHEIIVLVGRGCRLSIYQYPMPILQK